MTVVHVVDAERALCEPLPIELVQAIGNNNFAKRLLEAMRNDLPCSHCSVFALQSNGRVETISTGSAIGETAALNAREYSRLGFDLQDSNVVWLNRRKPGKGLRLWVSHQRAEEIADEEYRFVCYGSSGIRERLSLLAIIPEGNRLVVNFYRNLSYSSFGTSDVAWLEGIAPLLHACVMGHLRCLAWKPSQGMQKRLMSELTSREREVITHILAGMTTKEAAAAMRISPTTALTYRYRAFRRLGVRTARELTQLGGRIT